ncbi:PAS domain-containing sensor histidine kinase [Desertivirga xinjiangensis]|uniref:PAS domain-containing sensor histidine kinase n=1 Tax=Desertivirga xinjiangensis TaxID=539206 RepID=UPI00210D680D|nr:PAS domain S-box protein [Pedobacter xinjiangensis]
MDKVAFDSSDFRNLLDNLPGMLYRCKFDQLRAVLYVNPGCLDLTGFTQHDFRGEIATLSSITHPEDRQAVWEHISFHLSQNTPWYYEYRITDKNGKLKWVSENAKGVFDDNGNLLFIDGHITDISSGISARKHHKQAPWPESNENDIRETRGFYENIINNVNVDIAVFDQENKYRLVNESAIKDEKLRQWIIGKDDYDYCIKKNVSSEIAAARYNMYKLVDTLKKPVEWIEELVDTEGNKRFYVRTVKPFKSPLATEEVGYKIVYGLNITALKLVQNELLRRENLLSVSHKLAKVGYWVWYFKVDKLDWSDVIFEILGINRTDTPLSYDNYRKYIHPADREYASKILEEGKRSRSSYSIEYRIITSEGTIKYIKEQSSAAQANEEEYIFGVVQDITDLKLSEEALANRENHFKAIAESSPVLITEVDRDRMITYINFLKVRKREDVIGASVLDLVADKYQDVFNSRLEDCFNLGHVQRLEIQGKGVAGWEWYDVNMGPVRSHNGNVQSVVLLSQNITEKKQNEELREKLIKEINHRYNELMQFNYVVSHNLRAPVANILGATYLLNMGLPEEETNNMYSYLKESAESIDKLIRDLNNVLSARSPLNEIKEDLTLSDMIKIVCYDLEQQIKNSNAVISTEISSEADQFTSIKSYIQSIIHSLLSNAIKFKDHTRPLKIAIKAVRRSEGVLIEFSDNGIGIDLNVYKDQIFGLYKRFSDQSEGKGLGLHMTKAQVESLGGNITVESEVGKGTTFKIMLSN